MQVRVTLTETEHADGSSDAFVVAWPLDNDPARINALAAETVKEAVGGLPVALAANGDLYTHGRPEHALEVVETGLDGRRWAMFNVPASPAPLGNLRTLRQRPKHPTRPLAA